MPGRGSAEQLGRPPRRGPDGGGQEEPGVVVVPAPPQGDRADPDDGADGRGQRHRVVGVDDPLPETDGQPGHEQPAAPEDHGGADDAGAGGPPAQPQQRREEYEGGGQQPGDLAAEVGVEQAEQPGGTPAPGPAGGPAADAAGLAAVQPAEAVVAEDQVEDAVVLRCRAGPRPA